MADIVAIAEAAGEDTTEMVMFEGATTGSVSLMDSTTDVLDIQNAQIGELTLSVNTTIGELRLTSGDPDTELDPAAGLDWLMRHREQVDAAIAQFEAPAE